MSQILELADSIFAAMPDNTKKLFIALIIIVCVDYITGICAAIKEKKLSSKIGAKGIASKVTIFSLSALGAVLDHLITGGGSTICSLTILFYCSNELISICENAQRVGLPLPPKLTALLKDFHGRHNQS